MTWIALAALAGMTAPWAQPYDLRLNLSANDQKHSALCAQIVDIQLTGMSMGLSGAAESNTTLYVTEVSAEQKTVGLRVQLSDVKVVFNEAEQSPPALSPMDLKVTDRGRILSLTLADASNAFDLLATGGTPVQLLAIPMAVARFPEKPLEVGEEWESEEPQPTPFGVDATIKLKGKLAEVSNGRAKLQYTITVYIPPFRAPNPLQPGVEMIVKDGVVQLTDFMQVVDLKTGLVEEAYGRLAFSLEAEMPGWNQTMPASLQLDFAGGADLPRAKALLEGKGEAPQPAAGPVQQGQFRPQAHQGAQVEAKPQARRATGSSARDLRTLWDDWSRRCEVLKPQARAFARYVGLRLLMVAMDIDRTARGVADWIVDTLSDLALEAAGVCRSMGYEGRG